ncbi:sigma-70 family RNA polymerase sigma factor [Aggregatilineales bacterium SYSU G02658]
MEEPYTDDCAQVAAAQRSRQAFGPLFDRYYGRVYAYAVARLADERDAQDVTAETFRRAVAGLASFQCQHEGSFAAWLFRIAHNEVLRAYGRARPTVSLEALPEFADSSLDLDHALDQQQQIEQVRRLLDLLSPRRREIVALRFYGEMRNREIAEALGLDERTVAAHLCRALDDLRALMQLSKDQSS